MLSGSMLLQAHAQEPFALLRDRTDVFTGTRVLDVGLTDHHSGPEVVWHARSERYSLQLRWTVKSDQAVAVLEGDPLFLRLDNGTVITLLSDSSVVAFPARDAHGVRAASGMFSYTVDLATAEQLSHSWVERIRFTYTAGSDEFDATTDAVWQYAFAHAAGGFHSSLHNAFAQPAALKQGTPPARTAVYKQ